MFQTTIFFCKLSFKTSRIIEAHWYREFNIDTEVRKRCDDVGVQHNYAGVEGLTYWN